MGSIKQTMNFPSKPLYKRFLHRPRHGHTKTHVLKNRNGNVKLFANLLSSYSFPKLDGNFRCQCNQKVSLPNITFLILGKPLFPMSSVHSASYVFPLDKLSPSVHHKVFNKIPTSIFYRKETSIY